MSPSRKLKLERRLKGMLNFRPLCFCRGSSSDPSKACGRIGCLGSGTAGSSACACWGSGEGEIVAGIERNSTNHAKSG
ncbi:hypothetical protein NA56DRAFT_110049 [Hyaloscypha hepaticicola]|uniref:Uncharacterized protein n=1 Tax=Hyaloscypha hepaticicola TaxID=2082293 RepID=A0A2J6Q6Y3_9HELO|nr:hypothetical protein NA56DRAFT_110049 [Hyaloscypha hepaticicola]